MSLKAFHIFFITVSSLVSIGFGVWCFIVGVFTPLGVGALITGAGLIVYGKSFLAKMKREGIE